ncbi:hypothetical protein Hanom_Chr03g00214251 [Helianthus anomalus]
MLQRQLTRYQNRALKTPTRSHNRNVQSKFNKNSVLVTEMKVMSASIHPKT